MPYTIGQMAEKLGVAPSTLRYYDKEGLLPFVERTAGGIRIFSDGDLETLKIINCLKDTGMQIKDIRNFISMNPDRFIFRTGTHRKSKTALTIFHPAITGMF